MCGVPRTETLLLTIECPTVWVRGVPPVSSARLIFSYGRSSRAACYLWCRVPQNKAFSKQRCSIALAARSSCDTCGPGRWNIWWPGATGRFCQSREGQGSLTGDPLASQGPKLLRLYELHCLCEFCTATSLLLHCLGGRTCFSQVQRQI